VAVEPPESEHDRRQQTKKFIIKRLARSLDRLTFSQEGKPGRDLYTSTWRKNSTSQTASINLYNSQTVELTPTIIMAL
jgi:hypothetical protein